jgi:hypothetical protein
MTNETIITNNTDIEVSLIDNEDELISEDEVSASISRNPACSWVKFILTDNMPDGNKRRIPVEEFKNIIHTGIFMPLKMELNTVSGGHPDSKPLGVITHLKEDGNKIKAIAAIWSRERPEDVKLLKEAKANHKPLNVSWEILYGDTKKNEDGTTDLLDTSLKAVAIVGNPAYKGRTPILAVAELDSLAYLKELPNESFLVPESRQFQVKDKESQVLKDKVEVALTEIQDSDLSEKEKKSLTKKAQKLLDAQSEILVSEDNKLDEQEYTQKITELQTKLDEANAKILELSPLQDEIGPLREFKASVEKVEQENTKLAEIKEMFDAAKVKKDEKYFSENKDRLLALDKGSLEFMLQEVVAGLTKEPAEEIAENKNKIPPVTADTPTEKSPKELAQALKELRRK